MVIRGFRNTPGWPGAETIWFTRAGRVRFYSNVKDPARPTADLRKTAAAERVRLWDAGTGKDACPTGAIDRRYKRLPARGDRQGSLSYLSITDGKKRFGCFCFVFMEIRAVIGFGLKKRAASPPKAGKHPCRLCRRDSNQLWPKQAKTVHSDRLLGEVARCCGLIEQGLQPTVEVAVYRQRLAAIRTSMHLSFGSGCREPAGRENPSGNLEW
jgi:hypothetical protein